MKPSHRVSLLVKTLLWLVLHLLVLALVFFVFVRWQLGLGLDSLLSGAAGERLRGFGESVQSEISDRPRPEWEAAIKRLADAKSLSSGIFDPTAAERFSPTIPRNILDRAMHALPPESQGGRQRYGAPPWSGGAARPPGGGGPPGGPPFRRGGPFNEQPPPSPEDQQTSSPARPVFLAHGDDGGYWAGVVLSMRIPSGGPAPQLLLIRSDRLDGGGMFFDLKPWFWGGAAVLALSLAFWTPFILSITRYLHHLTRAADKIAAGNFQIQPPPDRSDELGGLGRSIQTMAARLDLHVTGQKRFLGDAAHELCAPLARLRAGIGILEHKLDGSCATDLAAIDAEAGELATLVEEILAFSRARIRPAVASDLELETIIHQAAARERAETNVHTDIPPGLMVHADPGLLCRALCNILRNSLTHAGPHPRIDIKAAAEGSRVILLLSDNGPGVAGEELPKLFEPFYRPDLSRTRDTGGCGLGLAIVAAAMEACGGSASAFLPPGGGFGIRLELPQAGDRDATRAI